MESVWSILKVVLVVGSASWAIQFLSAEKVRPSLALRSLAVAILAGISVLLAARGYGPAGAVGIASLLLFQMDDPKRRRTLVRYSTPMALACLATFWYAWAYDQTVVAIAAGLGFFVYPLIGKKATRELVAPERQQADWVAQKRTGTDQSGQELQVHILDPFAPLYDLPTERVETWTVGVEVTRKEVGEFLVDGSNALFAVSHANEEGGTSLTFVDEEKWESVRAVAQRKDLL
jgi:hypothetical protein